MIYIGYVFTVMAVLGTILNSRQSRWGFVLWIVSNGYFIMLNIIAGIYLQALLFVFNLVMAIIGFIVWGKKKKEKEQENV